MVLNKYKTIALMSLIGLFGLFQSCLPVTSALPNVTEISDNVNLDLTQYMVELINKDRSDNNSPPVVLGTNSAAQQHADDMLANYYLSHWGTDGLKPYMRYTRAGGINYESDNSAYHGWYDNSDDPNRYEIIDLKEVLKQLQYNMMYDDADSNWGHRNTILDKMNRKVNIGIAFDKHRLALVQQFEGDYVVFTQLPAIVNGKLYLAGNLNLGDVYSVHIFFDSLPQSLGQKQLLDKPHYYDIGEEIGYVLPPKYRMEGTDYVNATKWKTDSGGSFEIEANISPLLKYPKGVYNICLVASVHDEPVSLTNYSLFIR